MVIQPSIVPHFLNKLQETLTRVLNANTYLGEIPDAVCTVHEDKVNLHPGLDRPRAVMTINVCPGCTFGLTPLIDGILAAPPDGLVALRELHDNPTAPTKDPITRPLLDLFDAVELALRGAGYPVTLGGFDQTAVGVDPTVGVGVGPGLPMPRPRELTSHRVNGVNEKLRVIVLDQPGSGGACHDYIILIPQKAPFATSDSMERVLLPLGDREELWLWPQHGLASITERQGSQTVCTPYAVQRITFQNGPIKEAGINGNTQEALLAILIDRLEGFQSGQYACHDNQMALDHLQGARLWLHKRTVDRAARGVEGTLKK